MPGNDLRLFWLIEELLTRLLKDERAPLLAKAIEEADSVATPVRLVQGLAHRLNVDAGSVRNATVSESMGTRTPSSIRRKCRNSKT